MSAAPIVLAGVIVFPGDSLMVLRTLPAGLVDAIVTDPPYGLDFMGKEWDGFTSSEAFGAWCKQWATECLRVLKPGGHMLAFGGTRTWHRLACAVEDAGFEMRDSIAWLYGSGFPKSLDVSKAIDKAAGATREVYDETRAATPEAVKWQGWGTALKPAFEPIVVGRKPLIGTVAANVLAHGTGALNIDATRIEAHDSQLAEKYASVAHNTSSRAGDIYGVDSRPRNEQPTAPHAAGRWPTNVVLGGDTADALDAQTGTSRSTKGKPRASAKPGDGYGMTATGAEYNDEGGASRFFPVFRYQAKAPTRERPKVNGVAHPTVKPLDLMRWLVRLVTPAGGTVLDPFAGSGTTVEAALLEGFHAIAIEREPSYLPLVDARIRRATEGAA